MTATRIRAIVLWLAVSVISSGASSFMYAVGVLYDRLDALSVAIKRGDAVSAGNELGRVQSFYRQADRFHLGYIFAAATEKLQLFSASYLYLVGDYEAASKELEGVEDYRAFHVSGIAKFRFAQAAYLAGERRKALDFALNQAAPDFEKALRLGPDWNFDDKWNYDLLSNKEAAEKALKKPEIAPKVKLGYEDAGPSKNPEQEEKRNELDEQRRGGSGQKRRG